MSSPGCCESKSDEGSEQKARFADHPGVSAPHNGYKYAGPHTAQPSSRNPWLGRTSCSSIPSKISISLCLSLPWLPLLR
jgi:hypothetical protein